MITNYKHSVAKYENISDRLYSNKAVKYIKKFPKVVLLVITEICYRLKKINTPPGRRRRF